MRDRSNPRQGTWSERKAVETYLKNGGSDSWGDGSYLTWRGNIFTGRYLERSSGGKIKEWVTT